MDESRPAHLMWRRIIIVVRGRGHVTIDSNIFAASRQTSDQFNHTLFAEILKLSDDFMYLRWVKPTASGQKISVSSAAVWKVPRIGLATDQSSQSERWKIQDRDYGHSASSTYKERHSQALSSDLDLTNGRGKQLDFNQTYDSVKSSSSSTPSTSLRIGSRNPENCRRKGESWLRRPFSSQSPDKKRLLPSSSDLRPGGLRRSLSGQSSWSEQTHLKRYGKASNEVMAFSAERAQYSFKVITTPTSDTEGTALYLHFDEKRYLFGRLSEGLQRACIERGVGLKKVKNIFLSGKVAWENTGGLVGLLLSLADTQNTSNAVAEPDVPGPEALLTTISASSRGKNEAKRKTGAAPLALHGGEKLLHTLACCRKFVFRQSMPVNVHLLEGKPTLEEPTWKDENIKVWAMAVSPSAQALPILSAASQVEHETGQRHRQAAVDAMFNSDWDRNHLTEQRLSDVEMPAALYIRHPVTNKITRYTGPKPGDGTQMPDITVLVKAPWPTALIGHLPPFDTSRPDQALSYIIQGYPQRAKFNPQAAKALGVPSGPAFKQLIDGQTYTTADGNVVTQDMVLGQPRPGQSTAVVDLPSREYIANLIERPEWRVEHISISLSTVCWILGPGVVHDLALQEFMRSLPKVSHTISSPDICPDSICFDGSAELSVGLSTISRKNFMLPRSNDASQRHGNINTHKLEVIPKLTVAKRGLILKVEPRLEVHTANIPANFNPAVSAEKVTSTVRNLAQKARREIQEGLSQDKAPAGSRGDFDPEIITLGTGSSMPSKYRNVSATLLRTGKYGNYLFDCGEDTLGQLKRIFEPAELREVFTDLKLIFISHMHADHHLGTVSILNARQAAVAESKTDARLPAGRELSSSVAVCADLAMLDFLDEYSSVETLPPILPLTWSRNSASKFEHNKFPHETAIQALFKTSGLQSLTTALVDHCVGARAGTLTFANGFKISYSGDCRPSASFAEIGRDSDVLIHEATFDDGMEPDALAKKHCTIGEALGVAARMKAKNVILTHFSQRYPKMPNLDRINLPTTQSAAHAAPQRPDMSVCAAFDMMRVRVSEIKDMYRFTPALTALLNQEELTVSDLDDREGMGSTESLSRKRERDETREETKQKGAKTKGKISPRGTEG